MYVLKPVIKINYLVPFRVVKNLPDTDSLLCNIPGTEIFAQLPRKYTIKQYKVGETDWAAILEIKGARITLTQKSPPYTRKLIEYLLKDELLKHNLRIKKVAQYRNLVKVLVAGSEKLTNKELANVFGHWLNSPEKEKYFPGHKIVFVAYHNDIEKLIKSLLVYEDQIAKVIYFETLALIRVHTENGSIGLLIGDEGKNIITARKLLSDLGFNTEIEIKPA